MSSSSVTHVRRRVMPTLARIALVALGALLLGAGTATMAVAAPAPGPPSITRQPTDTTPTEGGSYGFTVAFISVPSSGADWQMSTDGGTTWTPARGATSSAGSEDPDTGEQESYIGFRSADVSSSGTLYRAVITNSEGTATSASARLTVTPTTPTGRARADVAATVTVPSTVRDGSTFTITLVVRNTGPNPASAVASGIALPPGLTVLSAGGGSTGPDRRSVGFSDPTLAPGASATHRVRAGIERGARGTRTIGGGVISTRTVDPACANNYQLRTITIR